ncbi:MAG: RluA family pseudouridine synthase [Acholeplasmatales bacterium]|jgi:23S rRNA pseudouridine1911/1915/1917 synthase|nr:RluA family pseudouridine synthase [Acholeplasmataceae bacterium]MCK9289244.1 RluA family pseudouridine synthase [Acholeplasmataceae bacterium]MCK9427650.1 RluA family pseudouridine synthase [Acholeplasmataceae bacterium]MDY0115739.1 RluA family pseudouridine synthase [Acholeplasmatales bacterium]
MIKEIIKEEKIRLDIYLTKLLEDYSRSEIKELFKADNVLVNNKAVKPSYLTKLNDKLLIKELTFEKEIIAKNLRLPIVYEDEAIIIINKPKGLLTHPATNKKEDSVVNHLLYHTTKLANIANLKKAGIVHRLDKDTSGLLIVAKTDDAYHSISKQFKKRTITKNYYTIVHGNFEAESGTIIAPIKRDPISKVKMIASEDGKEALTDFNVIKQNSNYAYLNIDLITGRTHQIRVHFNYIKHPLIGDGVYGIKDDFSNDSFFLHAHSLTFTHPITKKEVTFKAPLPQQFQELLKELFHD